MFPSKARLREEVHPRVLKRVSFASEVSIKEFKKDAHPSSRYGTRLTEDAMNDIPILSEETSGSNETLDTEDLKYDDVSIMKHNDSEDNWSLEKNDLSGSEEEEDDPEEKLETCERPQPMSLQSVGAKFCFKKEKSRKPKKSKLKNCFKRRTILLVGDMACGKSSIVTTYCKDRFSEVYTPTILRCCESDAKIAGRLVKMNLIDVPGRFDYKPIRCTVFKNIDIAILCYSAGNVESFEHIRTHWLPELKECAPECPFVLAETKKDIRDEYNDAQESESTDDKNHASLVPSNAGEELAKEIEALGFYSCSAKFRIGTRSLMEGTTLLALKKSRKMK